MRTDFFGVPAAAAPRGAQAARAEKAAAVSRKRLRPIVLMSSR
jgi:hypothetical protein